MASDASASQNRTYSIWLAFGEPIIVSGNEPVWEEPGKQARLLTTIEAPDYETACFIYNNSVLELAESVINSFKQPHNESNSAS